MTYVSFPRAMLRRLPAWVGKKPTENICILITSLTIVSMNTVRPHISRLRNKCGQEKRRNYNLGAEGHRVPQVTKKKELPVCPFDPSNFPCQMEMDPIILQEAKPQRRTQEIIVASCAKGNTGWHYSHLEGKIVHGYQVHAAIVSAGKTALLYSQKP